MQIDYRKPLTALLFSLLMVSAAVEADAQYVSTLESAEFNTESTAIYIEDLKTGEVVLDLNGEMPLMPASVMKIVTAASLLSNKDSDMRFRTRVTTEGELRDSVLDGDIVIHATGDPTIETAFFPTCKGLADSIADRLLSMGVKTVRGSIRFDYPEWMEEPVPSGWKTTDLIRPYGTGYHAFNYADNRMAIRFPSATTTPPTPAGTVKYVRSGKKFSLDRDRNRGVIRAAGMVRRRGRTDITSNPNPEGSFEIVLRNKLTDRGISIGGKGRNTGDEIEIFVNESPEIADILRSMMHRSDNLYAEAMLNALTPGGRDKATAYEKEIWASRGVDTKDVAIRDGSGLSRDNRLTAYFLADVLAWMVSHANEGNAFVNLFPAAGQEGTVRRFLSDTPLEGELVLKSGSVNDVQCYAGYRLDDVQNPSHIIVILSNDFGCSREKLKKGLQKLLIEKL